MKLNKAIILILVIFLTAEVSAKESICYGTTSNGKLKNGVELPSGGANYVSYSSVARIAGRTYVHSAVRDIIVAAYKELEIEQPRKVYKYAETGFEEGGQFKPHKTHRNGLSVDFMTPVTNKKGESVHLPTNPFNKFGYNIEFNAKDEYDDLKIDYEALAAHIVSLDKQAKKLGYGIWRVIFDPKLQPNLLKTQYADYLKKNIEFSKKPSWVRHDEHYHVDFIVPCEKLN
ncbi:replication initiation protein [Aliikangiella marina]|uniref:Replication initiation protein n=1 Tax=Aliikangiella marina TaxID=1712262 RepID=A0A545T4W0_9GAMM|nr:penicillin-insensitive murein endopeptidase [Aliikangiella marina]TQV72246.1 replication initiation protein [Aliikangiella marina]